MKYMHMIERRRVKDAFGRHATEYDAHVSIQKRVIARLLNLLGKEKIAPRRLLDVGAGTGMLIRSLREIFNDTSAVGIDLAIGMSRTARENLKTDRGVQILTAEAEYLPFSAESFDLVLSTSTFQWLRTLDAAFGESFRVLAPGGLFCFALFGERTLHELRASYRLALGTAGRCLDDRTHDFFPRGNVALALEYAGFTECRVISELDLELHKDVPELLRSLKRIGAGNASPIQPLGLAGKGIMLRMMDLYREKFGMDSCIPATYEIIYGMGKKAY
jgi:malonyl-CoA O-methyltransferase